MPNRVTKIEPLTFSAFIGKRSNENLRNTVCVNFLLPSRFLPIPLFVAFFSISSPHRNPQGVPRAFLPFPGQNILSGKNTGHSLCSKRDSRILKFFHYLSRSFSNIQKYSGAGFAPFTMSERIAHRHLSVSGLIASSAKPSTGGD